MDLKLPKLEKKILRFWKKNQTFEKSIEKRKKRPSFVFYEGPPTANAKPGIHHVLARVFKDIVCRYRTMRGFLVLRKAGWDTHGLPVELEIEKKLAIKNKKEIEKYGISKFNKECKKSVWKYKKEWERLTERIGFWLDLKNPYITYEPSYIESVWWILKKIWEKGLLYEDYRVSPYCPRCQTILSSHEVAQGYRRIKEPAIYVKFPILNPEFKNTSLLVWTTTPWTLPGNVAVAINENFKYCQVKIGEEFFIIAKERIEPLRLKGEIIQEFSGKDLLKIYYQPPYPIPEKEKMTIYKVVSGDFVSLKEGTGLVHIAPAFGEEDMEVIKKENAKLRAQGHPEYPIILTIDDEGKFTLNVKKWAGLFVKDADPLIIEDLKEKGILFKEELYEHDYPFCWRCHTPLLYYAKKSWFIKMTSLKEKLIENNQKINWIPEYLKEGRFGEWLREVKDWALSRERYWGTPLPVWECKSCGAKEVIGSREDLLKQKFSKNRYLLLRHGESKMNKKGIISSTLPENLPLGLTENGKKEIENACQKLKKEKIDLIISSDLLRARETAEIVARELGIKPLFDKRLRDIKAGVFEGKKLSQFLSFWKSYEERFFKKLKGGENYTQVKMRMYKFLKELEEKYQGKTILLIGHQRPFALLEGAVKGFEIKEFLEKIEPHKMTTGEIREIEFKIFPYDENGDLDFHRPFIDEVKFFCPKCGGIMERRPEVIDCWFDSGAMPFAQAHWPFAWPSLKDSKAKIQSFVKKGFQFPADFICEAIDQTRGWFYTLLAISTLLEFGPAYKNVISLGHVLDEKGEKMSKSKGNVVDPWFLIEKYGTEAIRWYFYTVNQPSDPKLFSEKEIEEAFKRFILIFWNCFIFYQTYKKRDKLNLKRLPSFSTLCLLDKWVISRLNKVIKECTQSLENYQITKAARLIEEFVLNDLSLWYIRRSRKKFQFPQGEKEHKRSSQVLGFVLLNLAKLTAPFLPFLSEYFYQKLLNLNFKSQASVHLEDWPKVNEKFIDDALEKKMEKVREIVSLVLSERKKAKIKVRQPLATLKLRDQKIKKDEELIELIKEEVNVKEIIFDKTLEKELELDLTITPQLREEGIIREIIRQIQLMRKEGGFRPKDKIVLKYWAEGQLAEILAKNQKSIANQLKIKDFSFEEREIDFGLKKEIKIDNQTIILAIKKI